MHSRTHVNKTIYMYKYTVTTLSVLVIHTWAVVQKISRKIIWGEQTLQNNDRTSLWYNADNEQPHYVIA